MANNIYLSTGSTVTFSASGGDVAFSPASVAFQAGRKSAQWDLGVAPRPQWYEWRAKFTLQATPVVGETLDLYIATSDGTILDGTTTAADAAFTDENALQNMLYIGSLYVDTTTTDSIQGSGIFRMVSRYGVLVLWNNTAAETLSATGTDHSVIMTPLFDQIQ